MDLDLTQEQKDYQKELAGLCAEAVATKAADVDRKETFPRDSWNALADKGFFGLLIPEQYGGAGKDLLTGIMATQEVAAACASTSMAAGTSMWCSAKTVEIYGSDAIKDKYLPLLAKGEAVGAFATTEADCGSDLSAMKMTAEKDGDDYVINGAKSYVTNAKEAAFVIVLARTAEGDKPEFSAFLVPTDADGVNIGEPLKTMGLRGAVASVVKLKDCRVPADNLLGEPGRGLSLAMDVLDYTRLSTSAVALGIARAAFEHSKEHAEQRTAFGKPIGVFQDVSFRIADMHVEMDLARQLVYHAAWQKQQGMKCSPFIAGAKLLATETAVKNTGRAMSTLAGKGCLRSCAVERLYRDAKLTEVAGGTNDMMCQIVARNLLKD